MRGGVIQQEKLIGSHTQTMTALQAAVPLLTESVAKLQAALAKVPKDKELAATAVALKSQLAAKTKALAEAKKVVADSQTKLTNMKTQLATADTQMKTAATKLSKAILGVVSV